MPIIYSAGGNPVSKEEYEVYHGLKKPVKKEEVKEVKPEAVVAKKKAVKKTAKKKGASNA